MASSSKKILGKEDLANISSRMNMDFSRKIVEHLDRLPDRYYINLDNNIEDLIMHIRLLELAKYAKQLPVMIDVRSIQDDRESHETMQLVTQITVASDNTVRPMLFKQVLNAFAAMNLTFEDACAYQTTDKYTLGVFNLVECGYEVEDLKQALAKELYKLDTSEATVPPQHVAIEIGQQDKVGCSSWSGWTWEPSAYLDSEQRIVASKVIKRFILHAKKTVFVVEHDIIMATYLADKVIVYEGKPSIDCIANAPQSLVSGMNLFLSHLDITFRRDPTNYRPRINKLESAKDREQKNAGSYYYLDD